MPIRNSTALGRATPLGLRLNAWSFFFLAFGIFSIVLFHYDQFFPLWLSVALLGSVVLYVIRQIKAQRMGLMMALLFLTYLLPFVHIPEYLWYDFSGSAPSLGFGVLVSNPYMFDEASITLTAMLGATGALGMALGCSLFSNPLVWDTGRLPDGRKRRIATMSMPIWGVWALIGLGISAASAPTDTLLTAQYTQAKSLLDEANFASAWLVGCVILSFAIVDALLDCNPQRKRLKWWISLAAVAYVVVVLNLFRGQRTALPWLIAVFITYHVWVQRYTQSKPRNIPWLIVGIVLFLIQVASMLVGAFRLSLVDADIASVSSMFTDLWSEGFIGFGNLLQGTWSAVLLTPLSVAGDHVNDLLPMKWGRDYADILYSLPPGFIADFVGYERPLSANANPAWDMRYGIGGTHAVVLPFMNFRMAGVFLIPALWSCFLTRIEKYTTRFMTVSGLSLLLSVMLAAPHALWYAEKVWINTIIGWSILSFCYRISLSMGNNRHSLPMAHPA